FVVLFGHDFYGDLSTCPLFRYILAILKILESKTVRQSTSTGFANKKVFRSLFRQLTNQIY
ncbi:MAG: hypothetical protein LBI18_10855, partial [Planctomycetaceae bacterium]|nr:hypothetical protein [Planctomycetaceae bacterium]